MSAISTKISVFILTAYVALCSGQTGIPGAADAAKPAAGLIAGIVMDSVFGRPIAGAEVSVFQTTPPHSVVSTKSDENGRFSVDGLSAGRYEVSAIGAGYRSSGSGLSGRVGGRQIVLVVQDREAAAIELRLQRSGGISGRVTGQLKEAIPNAQVFAYRSLILSGTKRRWAPIGKSAQTDRNGEYQLEDLPEGRSFVVARPSEAKNREKRASGESAYIPTLYPGTDSTSLALPVHLRPGQVVSHVDFALARAGVFVVQGRGSTGSIQCTGPLLISLRPIGGTPGMDRLSAADPLKNYQFNGVPAGVFDLVGQCPAGNGAILGGKESVVLDEKFVGPINMTLLPIPPLTGKLHLGFDKGEITDMGALLKTAEKPRVKLGPLDGFILTGSFNNVDVDKDGQFSVSGLEFGNYRVLVDGLGRNLYVSGLRDGSSELPKGEISIRGDRAIHLSVQLGEGGSIFGQVLDAKGRTEGGVYVVIVANEQRTSSEDLSYWGLLADASGRFRFDSIPPAEYRVYAYEIFDASRPQELLAENFIQSKLAKVESGKSTEVKVSLIPPAR